MRPKVPVARPAAGKKRRERPIPDIEDRRMTPSSTLQPPTAVDVALPDVVVIGAMKCGTSALHRYLDDHPSIAMARAKEVNFFFGPAARTPRDWQAGNWHRGLAWYVSQFDPSAPVRGEASPGYTAPGRPDVAHRMAAVVPNAKLVYLVRDPLVRAVSQYRHHRRDGSEHRTLTDALLDPQSQYVARSRYFERLEPFLAHYPSDRVAVVATEDLLLRRRATLHRLYSFLGVDPAHWSPTLDAEWHVGDEQLYAVEPHVVGAFRDAVRTDVARLRCFTGQAFDGWSV